MPEKVEVYNENDIVKIKVDFDKIDLKAKLKESDFNLKDYIKEEEPVKEDKEQNSTDKNNTENKENTTQNDNQSTNNSTENKENTTDTECGPDCSDALKKPTGSSNSTETTNVDDIIYPLYIPSNTYLTSSETVETGSGNRVILTFSGEKNFVLIEEASVNKDSMEIIPVYGEPLLLSEAIGALSANSLSWDVGNRSYYLASTELTVNEMQLIANSLGNETLVANIK